MLSTIKQLFDTEHKRYKYYKKKFSFVAQETINLGLNKYNKKCNFQYVPLTFSLMELLKHEDVLMQIMNPRESEEGIISDFRDGQFYKFNNHFNKGRIILDMLFFHDDFQVTNPVGSHRKNHKIAGFYYILGNLYKEYRSSLKVIQLCTICRNDHLRYFGLHKILNPLITELKQLNESGIYIPGVGVFDCAFRFCSADNLGSHHIGGFLESFSPNVLRKCRTCLIQSPHIEKCTKAREFTLRTVDSYNRHALAIKNDPTLTKIYGVKFMSPLNEIPGFHVIQGLPPDLMHDVFEGIVPYEICLVLQQLIKDNIFTLDFFNCRISNFHYSSIDARNKPETQNLHKNTLIGTASQNWTLVRLLPLLIGDIIPKGNLMWNFFLHLKLIIEMLCSPNFTIGHLDILQFEIEDHLYKFKSLFSEFPLKPKHHYLLHYPQHILNFDPLINYWCFRFEAKHKVLKDIAFHANQFKNVPHTIAFRHQLILCRYNQSPNNFLNTEFEAKITEPLNVKILNSDIQILITKMIPFSNIVCAPKVTIGTTEYKTGQILVVGFLTGEPIFGKIELIITNDKDVWFIVDKCDCHFIDHYGSFSIHVKNNYDCIDHSTLINWHPLSCYTVGSNSHHAQPITLVMLKHMVFDLKDFL